MQLAMKNEEYFETSKMKNLKRGTKILSKKQRGGGGDILFFPRNKRRNSKCKMKCQETKKTITNIFLFQQDILNR